GQRLGACGDAPQPVHSIISVVREEGQQCSGSVSEGSPLELEERFESFSSGQARQGDPLQEEGEEKSGFLGERGAFGALGELAQEGSGFYCVEIGRGFEEEWRSLFDIELSSELYPPVREFSGGTFLARKAQER